MTEGTGVKTSETLFKYCPVLLYQEGIKYRCQSTCIEIDDFGFCFISNTQVLEKYLDEFEYMQNQRMKAIEAYRYVACIMHIHKGIAEFIDCLLNEINGG